MKIALKEVLWEVTSKCNRNCSFCGSKDIVNKSKDLTPESRLIVAKNIASLAETVTFTGGEPLTLNANELDTLADVFDKASIPVDLVTNGDLLQDFHMTIFRNIGVSVNSIDDIARVGKILSRFDNLTKIVLITNVNKINYFDLDKIIQFAAKIKVSTQFQLTMYKQHNAEMLNGNDINSARSKIYELCKEHKVGYVFADNMQPEHDCSAGMRSCGVLFNGDVIPCLSERSWIDEVRVQGNLCETKFSDIWMNGFKSCRFGECKSCRDCFDYEKNTDDIPNVFNPLFDDVKYIPNKECDLPDNPIMMLYGITIPNDVGDQHKPYWDRSFKAYAVTNVNDFNKTELMNPINDINKSDLS